MKRVKRFWSDQSGMAAVEAALLMPVMVTLLLGVVDIGNQLLVGKKAVTATQIVADLLTRHTSVTNADVTDAYEAAKMAVQPYKLTTFGVDIASIKFTGTNKTPTVLWRDTFNMTPNANATSRAAGLGLENEGVLVISTQYTYEPIFTNFFGSRKIAEVAVTRPRRGSAIEKK